MKKAKQRTVLAQLLISYFVVLFVAIFILVLFIIFNIISTYEQDMINSVTLQKNYIKQLIDDEFDLLDTSTRQFAKPFFFEDDTLYAMEIIDILAINDVTNSTVERSYIHFINDNYIFSSSSTYTLKLFFEDVIKFENIPQETALQLFTNTKEKTVIPTQAITVFGQTKNYLTVITPMFSPLGIQNANAIYLIDNNTIISWFVSGSNSYGTNHYLVSGKDILAQHSTLQNLPVQTLTDLIPEYNNGSQVLNAPETVRIDKNDYYYFIEKLDNLHDTFYITLLPQNQQFLGEIWQTSTQFIIVLGVVTVLCSIIIVWFARKNYSPIKILLNKTAATSPDNNISEFEQISNAIDKLKDENYTLSANMEKNLHTISNSHLQKLLTGKYFSIEEFNNNIVPARLKFNSGYYFVSIFINEGSVYDNEKICEIIDVNLNKYFQSRYVYTVEKNRIITINCTENLNLKNIDNAFYITQKELLNLSSADVTIGVGNTYTNVQDIAKSYLDAKTAIDYKFIYGKNSIIYFDSIYSDNNFVKFAYPDAELKELKNALKALNHEQIDEHLANILEFIRNENLPLFIAKGICFDILKLLNSSHLPKNQKPDLSFDIVDLSQIDTMEVVVDIIRKAQMALLRNNSEFEKLHKKELFEDILNYVKQNYLSVDFSVNNTAVKFKMQTSNLSMLFKHMTGNTLIDYVSELRMKKAGELLSKTDMKIDDICYEVGYHNTSSFIRRFKNYYKITPGEYRKNTEQ